jgi:hypothetical protein
MKKHFLTLIAIATFTKVSFSQVGVNSDNSAPHPSAQLDIKSTDKGLLIPRLTTLERNAIQNPEIGLMVFDKDSQEIFIYNSDGWKQGTLSKLPLILSSGNFNNILKVTNTKANSYPDGSTAAEFINNDILGTAVSAKSSGNLPTIDARNTSGTAIYGESSGTGNGGIFSSISGAGVIGSTQNNNAFVGTNNSETLPTAKFTNSGNGRALELIGGANITSNNSLNTLRVENNKPYNIGAISDEAAGVFINNSPYGVGLVSRTTNNGTAITAVSHGNGFGGKFYSLDGIGIYSSTQNNHATFALNSSSSIPVAKIMNIGGGPGLEVIGDASILSTNRVTAFRAENSTPINSGTGNDAAGLFIHSGAYGNAVIAKTVGSGTAIIASSTIGTGLSVTSDSGVGAYFFSNNNDAIRGYSINKSAIDMNNNSTTKPTAKLANYMSGGNALELSGNLEIFGKINQEAYQIPSFQNSWNNYGGEWNTAKFYKGKDSRVYLEGVVNGGSSNVIFTLPVGYRPASRIFFIVSQNGGSRGRIDIASNGEVRFEFGNDNTQVGLDGISFRVE